MQHGDRRLRGVGGLAAALAAVTVLDGRTGPQLLAILEGCARCLDSYHVGCFESF